MTDNDARARRDSAELARPASARRAMANRRSTIRRGANTRNSSRRRVMTLCLSLSLTLGVAAATRAAALAADGGAGSVSAAAGATSATLTYRSNHGNAPYSKLHLSITRSGQTLFDAPVHSTFCGSGCWPDAWPGHRYLTVADVAGDGSPDVVLDLYSGGAHCCSVVQVYRFDSRTHGYAVVQRNFWDPGASLRRLGGAYEFISADDHFAYAFTSFAFSGLPIQIWALRSSGFVNVTRRFTDLVAADAARQYRAYLANRSAGFGLGFIAAWAGDQDMLGHRALVSRTLATQNRSGGLRSADGLAQGSTFVTKLQRFLLRYGYGK